MRKTLSYFLYTLLLGAIACACSDDLSIRQSYTYSIETLPLPKALENGEMVDLEFSILREGYYEGTEYKFRYFQSEGEGILTEGEGVSIPVNRFQKIPADNFVLTYQCKSEEQQQLDFVFEDNFGQIVTHTITFSSKRTEKEPEPEPPTEEPINYNFSFTSLPVPSHILRDDTIEIICCLTKVDERNDATYSIRYFQSSGKGKLLLGNNMMQSNELSGLDNEAFRLYYVSNCEERQSIDVYIVDSRGQIVQQTFNFENIPIEPEPEVDFSFVLETLPVLKTIATDEMIEIRCTIKKADERNNSEYYIRYFQSDGKGELQLDNGTILIPNDLYLLDNQIFRLYYTSRDTKQQTIDIYIVDSQGKIIQKSFSFQNLPNEDDPELGGGEEEIE